MSLRARRVLYLSFIMAFLILTPSLIFYSLGYNLKSGFKIEKSGMLVINTEPKNAKIFIEDKGVQRFWNKILKQNKNFILTPAKIKNIKPGDYKIGITLDGYWPWQKKLTIHPGQTTFAEDIYLFKNNKPALIKKMPSGFNIFSPHREYFINIDNNQSQLINLASQEIKTIKFETDNQSNIIPIDVAAWSLNEKRILSNYYIFTTNNWDNPLSVKLLIGNSFSNAIWDNNKDDVIIYSYDNKVFSFNIDSGHNKEIIKVDEINTFLSKNNKLYLIEQTDTASNFTILDRSSNKKELNLELPLSDYNFINTSHNLINLSDTKHNILYIIDPDSKIRPLKEIIYNSKKTQWITNDKLLYTTGFEIWLFDLGSLEKKLLTRISEHINNIEWHPSNNYIVFSTNKSINILELDNREKHSITKIADFDNIDEMILDKKGEIVYFTTKEKDGSSLYKIFIQ